MVHQWNAHNGVVDFGRAQYHNAQFRDSARLVGLECDRNSQGYASTRPTKRLLIAIADFRPDPGAFADAAEESRWRVDVDSVVL
jgi:hypothetical protein